MATNPCTDATGPSESVCAGVGAGCIFDTSSSACKCDDANNFVAVSTGCACDSSKNLVANPEKSGECICNAGFGKNNGSDASTNPCAPCADDKYGPTTGLKDCLTCP